MNHESLWAKEGDVMRRCYQHGQWSLLASNVVDWIRSHERRSLHGFDFRVESDHGTKTMVKEES